MLLSKGRSQSGLSLIELVITMAILAILASAALPIGEMSVRRNKELELRRALRTIRTAIDNYKADYDEAVAKNKISKTVGESGYPEDLDVLIEGTDWGGYLEVKRKYLRRIPRDPFDRYDEGWGKRSYSDEYDSTVWGGQDVYDVYSQNTEIALDGTEYSTW